MIITWQKGNNTKITRITKSYNSVLQINQKEVVRKRKELIKRILIQGKDKFLLIIIHIYRRYLKNKMANQ